MPEPQCLIFGPFRLDRRDERLWRGPEAIPLPPKTEVFVPWDNIPIGRLASRPAFRKTLEATRTVTVLSSDG